ncbi:pyruvate decarboxylase [Lojkania enalia]|uniref:Pyruvate decarboxylase n=1 Tax=Lojkania enalia TaxID=147567 RepID=A0A9P4KBU0_9PLEO|nr:pyruvate decarboxylase [Didymosphaeria enalia]
MTQIKVGDYLFKRLHELGIRAVFGVPGDYELALLDLITDNDLEWKGNPNELVAAYAADGYARVKGAAACVTTFGPGETSAYCGMAGHFCEFVPVVHIVGYPTIQAIRKKAIMHHSLGNGKFDMYVEMVKQIMADTTVIDYPPLAASEIDRVLNTMMYEQRPVYIGLSIDIALEMISDAPLGCPISRTLPPNDPEVEKSVVSKIRNGLERADNPIIVIDGGAARHDVLSEAHEFVKLTRIPFFTTPMGKGSVNEDLPQYGGVHFGAGTHPGVKNAMESSDFVLIIGNFPSDFNTGEFTCVFNKNIIEFVDFQRFSVSIGEIKYPVSMKFVLQGLNKDLQRSKLMKAAQKVTWNPYPTLEFSPSEHLKQDFLWPTLGSFFRPGDYIIGETGTSAFGLCDSRLPAGAVMHNQTIFGSIGYATGAIVGVAQAVKESGGKWKRPILVTGEGSMHLTIQVLQDLLRFDLKPIIFVLNNGGYTVERLIHGKEALYNDVAVIDYGLLGSTFGPGVPSKYYGPIRTNGQLEELLKDKDFGNAGCSELVELILKPLDAPKALVRVGVAVDKFNKGNVTGAA